MLCRSIISLNDERTVEVIDCESITPRVEKNSKNSKKSKNPKSPKNPKNPEEPEKQLAPRSREADTRRMLSKIHAEIDMEIHEIHR